MTYSLTNTDDGNRGSRDDAVAVVDITSLDSAGYEPFDPDAVFGLEDSTELGVAIRGQEDPQYVFGYDHVNQRITVKNMSDGTDVTSGTDVGEVVVEAIGY